MVHYSFPSGKIVNFAGWLLPVRYREAIASSHQHTRTFASLFDVGHMLQTNVTGKDATELLESLTTSDLRNLDQGRATLTVFTNQNGGILDDLIINKDRKDRYFVVSNAARRNEDSKLLLEKKVIIFLSLSAFNFKITQRSFYPRDIFLILSKDLNF